MPITYPKKPRVFAEAKLPKTPTKAKVFKGDGVKPFRTFEEPSRTTKIKSKRKNKGGTGRKR